jgi:3-carboxy-cis,cis-muconate cycloisomerase
VRRAALTTPQLAATLHLAAALQVDERADGAWHAEWATLRDLGRRTVVAASQTTDLLTGLRVDTERMAANLQAAAGVDAEQISMIKLIDGVPGSHYRGASVSFVDAAVRRGRGFLEVT